MHSYHNLNAVLWPLVHPIGALAGRPQVVSARFNGILNSNKDTIFSRNMLAMQCWQQRSTSRSCVTSASAAGEVPVAEPLLTELWEFERFYGIGWCAFECLPRVCDGGSVLVKNACLHCFRKFIDSESAHLKE